MNGQGLNPAESDPGAQPRHTLLLEFEPPPSDGVGLIPHRLGPVLLIACADEHRGSPISASLPPEYSVVEIFSNGVRIRPAHAKALPFVPIDQWRDVLNWRVRARAGFDLSIAELSLDASEAPSPELFITPFSEGEQRSTTRHRVPMDPGAELIIGRSETRCHVSVPDEHVSSRHVRFFPHEGRVYAEDVKSTWGTLVNGVPLREPTALRHGDRLIIGKSTIEFVDFTEMVAGNTSAALGRQTKRTGSSSNTAPPKPSLSQTPLPRATPSDSPSTSAERFASTAARAPAMPEPVPHTSYVPPPPVTPTVNSWRPASPETPGPSGTPGPAVSSRAPRPLSAPMSTELGTLLLAAACLIIGLLAGIGAMML